MYRIRMRENKDFSEKECFFSGKTFRPGKVIAELARKCKGNFQPIGFIKLSEIKEFNLLRKQLLEVPLHFIIDVRSTGVREEQATSELKDTIRWFNERMAPIRKADTKIGRQKLLTLSMEEHREALRKQGIKC
ncbi:MAG: hypothetical protein JRL30_29980 [Deltaproteobacteria bacterium]|nr:hypothetical protein [Deltaproteobacteria bacterium]